MKTRRFEAGPDQPVATPGPVATSSDHLVALYKSPPIADGLRRPGDLVTRYGGEEFVIILPHTTASDAATLMEAIRRRIEGDALPHAGTALYRAKSEGRNRVLATPTP